MTPPSTQQSSLPQERITDLRNFAKLGITADTIQIYDSFQLIYERQERQKIAKRVSDVAVVVLVVGVVLLVVAFVAALVTMNAWLLGSLIPLIGLDGLFYFGYKQLVLHFYPDPSKKK